MGKPQTGNKRLSGVFDGWILVWNQKAKDLALTCGARAGHVQTSACGHSPSAHSGPCCPGPREEYWWYRGEATGPCAHGARVHPSVDRHCTPITSLMTLELSCSLICLLLSFMSPPMWRIDSKMAPNGPQLLVVMPSCELLPMAAGSIVTCF